MLLCSQVLRWVLLRKAIEEQDLSENDDALKVFMTLCSIPTLFEGQPEGSGEASDLIAQAYRQNVQGSFIQPLSSVQWVHICLLAHFGIADT